MPGSTPVFAVGTGQCGTRYFVSLLQENNVEAEHEPHPRLLSATTRAAHNSFPPEQLEQVKSVLRGSRQDTVVEANWGLSYFVDLIEELFEAPRYVFLHRDGRDYVRSLMSNWGLSPETGWMIDATTQGPFHEGDFTAPRFLRACADYAWTNHHLLHHLPLDTDRAYELPFEDLIDPTSDTLDAFFTWLDLGDEGVREVEPEGVQDEKTWPPKGEWPRPFRHVFYYIAGGIHTELGYPSDGSYERLPPAPTE